MQRKWIAVVVILICCLVYAITKFSMSELQNESENQNAYNLADKTQRAKQVNADDEATQAEGTQQMNVDDTDEAPPEDDASSTVPADQIEAVTRVFSEFQSAVKNEDYEQIWMFVSEVIKSRGSFEEYKDDMASGRNVLANLIIRPESTINIEDRVGLLVTGPSNEDNEEGMYFFFIQEDGQWKICGIEPAEYVDTSKE